MGRRETITFEGRQYRVATTLAWNQVPRDDFGAGWDPRSPVGDVASRLESSCHADAARSPGPGCYASRRSLAGSRSRWAHFAQTGGPGQLHRATLGACGHPVGAARRGQERHLAAVHRGRDGTAPRRRCGEAGRARRQRKPPDHVVRREREAPTDLDPGQCIATSVIKNATANASFVPGASGSVPPPDDDDGPTTPRRSSRPGWSKSTNTA